MATAVPSAPEDRPKGKLRVTVTDATGARVAQAEVRVVGADGKVWTIRADAGGVAEFVDLPVGQCEVRVQSPGFQIWRGISKVSGEAGRLPVSLEVGTVGEFVDVPMVRSSPTKPGAPPPKKRRRWWRRA